jgi:hypothetical protein
MTGVAQKGPLTKTRISSFTEFQQIYGGYLTASELPQAVEGFFAQGAGGTLWIERVVHYTDITNAATKTSAAASLVPDLKTKGASGTVLSGNAEPYNLEPGETLLIKTDGGAPETVTFNASAAFAESDDETFDDIAVGDDLIVSIDGGTNQTIDFASGTFTLGAATAAEVAAIINSQLVGGSAVVAGLTKVRIRSDTRGTDSTVQVISVGSTANSPGDRLNFPTTLQVGGGNVGNIDAVTAAEAVTRINAGTTGLTAVVEGTRVRLTSDTTGASSSVQVTSASTALAFGFDNAIHSGLTGAPPIADTLEVDGKYDGAYANGLSVQVLAATSGRADEFNFKVLQSGLILEVFANLTMDSTKPNYAIAIVNSDVLGSRYITITDALAAGTVLERRPADGTFGTLSGGVDGLVGLVEADYIGDDASDTGLYAFDTVKDLSLIAVPGQASSFVHNQMVFYAETHREGLVFGVLDPPSDLSASAMAGYVQDTALLFQLSEHAAIFWPELIVSNPSTSIFGSATDITVAPSGYVMGVMARTDQLPGGIYVQPAGIDTGVLRFVKSVVNEETLDEKKRDLVYPANVNPINFGTQYYIDGARTLKGDGNFPSIAESRGVGFIRRSIQAGLEPFKFKPTDTEGRLGVDSQIRKFLRQEMNKGAFRSREESKAFLVDVGDQLNPPSVELSRRIIAKVGLATRRPAEFIDVFFSQDTRALDAELSA